MKREKQKDCGEKKKKNVIWQFYKEQTIFFLFNPVVVTIILL